MATYGQLLDQETQIDSRYKKSNYKISYVNISEHNHRKLQNIETANNYTPKGVFALKLGL